MTALAADEAVMTTKAGEAGKAVMTGKADEAAIAGKDDKPDEAVMAGGTGRDVPAFLRSDPGVPAVAAMVAPVPAPGAPPGTGTPGLAASGAECAGGRIVRITRLAHAVPGKPEGEADTRPLLPAWQRPRRALTRERTGEGGERPWSSS
ncbi:MAG TPA: hypothetical protein VKV38_01120 [Trebonia sp.]|nr:hypothetical protein [Trebonia sp.]